MARIAENTVIVDGQEYKPGDVIPDFKSIKCVDTREPRKYQGLSADVSVLNDVIAKYASGGASCFMSDTGEYYEYDRKEKTWKLITNITERGFDSEKAYGALKHMLKNVTVSDEKIQSAVTDYLTVNPVLPGATTEQAQQIEQNKADVASLKEETGSLKEDLSNKITKFYASNQGETHITDSDNGKTQDMMLYGKSEQKQYRGKNLINSDEYYSKYKQNDGTYKGKASEFNKILVPISKYIGTQITVSCKVTVPLDTTAVLIEATINGAVTRGNRIESGKSGVIALTISPRTESDTIKITYGNGAYGIVVASEFQIEKGSEVTPYEPYVGGQPSPSPNYPQRIKSVVNPTVKVTNEDESKVQSVTLNNIILNAIPVSSGGNVTIDGQQYIADYVDVEREKLVRMVGVADQDTFVTSKWDTGNIIIYSLISNVGSENAIVTISSKFAANWSAGDEIHHFTQPTGQTLVIVLPKTITTVEQGEEIRAKGFKFYYILITPIEIDLTTEEITAFKALATYYPTTNISVNSEQLDGYTVFNYPISMENGWNYVKKQLNDNRDYIYDMDTRTQDMDIQAAEAYVNSEYAVALTELEV